MLTIKTYIANSPISGMGCFAGENIKRGEVVWVLEKRFDLILTEDTVAALHQQAKDYIKHFAYLNKNEGGYVLCGDNGKYFNHSSTPNCVGIDNYTVAIKDIQKGEEITEDYFSFDQLAVEKLADGIIDERTKTELSDDRLNDAAKKCAERGGPFSIHRQNYEYMFKEGARWKDKQINNETI